MTQPTPEHTPNPAQSPLPIVGEHVKHAIAAEFNESENLIQETYWRMVSQQPKLTDQMAKFIGYTGRDSTEQINMMRVMVLTYRMLEAQAEANQLEAQVNGPAPEAPSI